MFIKEIGQKIQVNIIKEIQNLTNRFNIYVVRVFEGEEIEYCNINI